MLRPGASREAWIAGTNMGRRSGGSASNRPNQRRYRSLQHAGSAFCSSADFFDFTGCDADLVHIPVDFKLNPDVVFFRETKFLQLDKAADLLHTKIGKSLQSVLAAGGECYGAV